ncbi:MAG: glutathione S-transferase family protein, partial [Gammaproteobacteria bacterium]|nr:glutathione S-transferase family protein [Gammaproteobacteria bacterium]
TFGIGSPDAASLEKKVPDVLRYAKVLDGHLAGKAHPACGRLTIADFQLASMATYWRTAAIPLESFSNVVRWLDRLDAIPAWAAPWPTGS